MKRILTTIITLPLVACLQSGCQSTAKQSDLGIDAALSNLGRGLAQMKVEELNQLTNACFVRLGQSNFNTGLYLADATVVFNVTASKSKNNTLALDLTASVPHVPVSGSIADTYTSGSAISHGNQIAIHFLSPLFSTTITTTTNVGGGGSSTSTNKASAIQVSDGSGKSSGSDSSSGSTKPAGGTVVTVVKQSITSPEDLAKWMQVVNGSVSGSDYNPTIMSNPKAPEEKVGLKVQPHQSPPPQIFIQKDDK